jgi:hypothetical protein
VKKAYTVGEVSEIFGVPVWCVRRIFERKLLPEPQRIGPFRAIPESDLPAVGKALNAVGYSRMAQSLLRKEELAPTQEATEGA